MGATVHEKTISGKISWGSTNQHTLQTNYPVDTLVKDFLKNIKSL